MSTSIQDATTTNALLLTATLTQEATPTTSSIQSAIETSTSLFASAFATTTSLSPVVTMAATTTSAVDIASVFTLTTTAEDILSVIPSVSSIAAPLEILAAVTSDLEASSALITATATLAKTTTATLLKTATATATLAANAPSTATSNPVVLFNYAKRVQWSSAEAAYIFMAIAVLMALVTIRNLVYKAKSKHTKTIYFYLLLWCIFRIIAFAVRGCILTGDNGQDFTLYKWASIVSSVGFMPLAEVLAFCTLEGTALAYGFTAKTRSRFDLLVKALFAVFGVSLTAFAIDFTCNKPFGSNPKDYTIDVVLREVGFNGLTLITLYTLFGSIRNMLAVVQHPNVPGMFVRRFRVMMGVVCVQSVLMVVKLVYSIYRNWNPFELRDEAIWYGLSIVPEYLFLVFYLNHGFLKVYDDIEQYALSEEDAKVEENKNASF
ncbi:hypothetical protein HDU81_010825 [Chytriomyces hyalinus]|nr:hypothetical protein HDU81_010825 [Chytriomyces hyalinus]